MAASIRVAVQIDLSLVDAVVKSVFEISGIKELYLPLPTKGFLTSFEAIGESFRIVGKVEEKYKAQEIFERAVEENNDAILISYKDEGIVHLKFNVIEDVTISLTSIAPLDRIGDKIGLVLPVKVTPRYGSREVFSWPVLPMRIDSVVSKYPTVIFHGDTQIYAPMELLATDAISFFIERQLTPIIAKVFNHDGQKLVTVEGMLAPTNMKSKRRILFIGDCSGSMFQGSGDRILGLKIAVETSLLQLTREDEFNIMCFGGDYQFLFEDFAPFSDESLEKARNLLQNLPNLGNTRLMNALMATLNLPAHDILLLTDGDIERAPELARKFHLPKIHILGIGIDNNRTAIANLASLTKGSYELSNKKSEIILGVNRLLSRCGENSSAIVSLNGDETVIYPDYPIFIGANIKDEELELKIDGKVVDFPTQDGDFETAQRYASHILQLYNYVDDSNSRNSNMVELAVKFKIVCHLSSLIGVSRVPRNKKHHEELMSETLEVHEIMVNNIERVLERGERLSTLEDKTASQFMRRSVKLSAGHATKSSGGWFCNCLVVFFCCPCVVYIALKDRVGYTEITTQPVLEAKPQGSLTPEAELPQKDDFDLLSSILLGLNSEKKFVVNAELESILRGLGLTNFSDETIWEFIKQRFPEQKIIYENLV